MYGHGSLTAHIGSVQIAAIGRGEEIFFYTLGKPVGMLCNHLDIVLKGCFSLEICQN